MRVLFFHKGAIMFPKTLSDANGYKDWYIPFVQFFNTGKDKWFMYESEYNSSVSHKEFRLNEDIIRIKSDGKIVMD